MPAINGQPAPKPSQLPEPAGKEQQSEVDAFFAAFDAPDLEGAAESAQALDSTVSGGDAALATGLDAAARVADYPGGFARAGLASTASTLSGQENVVTPEDLKAIAVGKGPSSEEYLKRLGVPEGGSFEVFGKKITQRGAAGLALDVATDPLTQVAKLAKSVPYIKKLVNLPGAGSEALGKAVYKSAFSKADEELLDAGKMALSNVMIEAGAPVGSAAKLNQKISDMSETLGKLREGLYSRANELGAHVDVKNYPLKKTEAVLERMKRDPNLAAAAGELEGMLNNYRSQEKVSLALLSEWKTNLYDGLPNSAFSGNGKLKGLAKQFKAALASDFKDAIIATGNKYEKGLGDGVNAINEKWGTLLDAPAIKGGSAGTLGRIIDGAVLATGGIDAAVKKKAFDLATGTASRTAVGRALMEFGQKDLANRLTRQAIIKSQRPKKEEE